MIHSILPPEYIMGLDPGGGAVNPQSRHTAIQNGVITTSRDASGQDRISSLFSTDPYDYLDPRYQPGNPW